MKTYTTQYSPTRSEGRLDVKVRFNNGKSYYVCFCDPAYVETELGDLGCFAIPGLIMLDEASMEQAEEVLNFVVSSGFFNALKPIEDGGE
jgi:hypothetical protein